MEGWRGGWKAASDLHKLHATPQRGACTNRIHKTHGDWCQNAVFPVGLGGLGSAPHNPPAPLHSLRRRTAAAPSSCRSHSRHPLRHHLAAQLIIFHCQLFDLPLVSQRLSCVGGPVASAAELFVVSDCFITVVQQPYNVLGRPN